MKVLLATATVLIAVTLTSAATAGQTHNTPTLNAQQSAMKAMILKAFGTGWQGQTMLCIARRESNLRPTAINWSDRHPTSEGTFKGSFGLFQIGALHVQHTRGQGRQLAGGNVYRLLDPRVNIAVAKRMARGGLGPWRSTNSGC